MEGRPEGAAAYGLTTDLGASGLEDAVQPTGVEVPRAHALLAADGSDEQLIVCKDPYGAQDVVPEGTAGALEGRAHGVEGLAHVRAQLLLGVLHGAGVHGCRVAHIEDVGAGEEVGGPEERAVVRVDRVEV